MSHMIMRIMSYNVNKLEYLGHELQSTVVLHSCCFFMKEMNTFIQQRCIKLK